MWKYHTFFALPLLSFIIEVEGWCCSPIICQQFCCRESVPTMTSHEHHTLGRGPASVAMPPAPQGVGLLPSSSSKRYTRLLIRASGTATATGDKAGLGMSISLGREVGQRTQSRPISGE